MFIKRFLFVMCIVLIAAMALSLASCKGEPADTTQAAVQNAPPADIGQGAHYFTFTVTANGTDKVYNVKTDKTTVGEALEELGLIGGEEGPYGLYVKTVDGIAADYDEDKTYWSFYVGGAYALSGADKTDIKDGESYAFKKEKG